MARRNFSNTVSDSVLTTSTMSAASTTVNIDSGGSWPAPPFTALAEAEVLLVTGVSGGASTGWTVTRGYDGTTPAVHAIGVNVRHVAVASDYENKPPAWMYHLTAREDTPHADDDEFDDDTFDASWTKVEPSGTVTLTEKRDVLSGLLLNQTGSHCCAFVKPIASGSNVVLEVAWRAYGQYDNFLMLGPLFSLGTTAGSNMVWQMTYFQAGDNVAEIRYGTFNGVNTIGQAGGNAPGLYYPITHFYQRFEYDSTNGYRQWHSGDGISWTLWGNGWLSNPYGAPTHMGFGYSTWGNTQEHMFSLEYFRVNPT